MTWKGILLVALVAGLVIDLGWRTWNWGHEQEEKKANGAAWLSLLLQLIGYGLWVYALLWGWFHL